MLLHNRVNKEELKKRLYEEGLHQENHFLLQVF